MDSFGNACSQARKTSERILFIEFFINVWWIRFQASQTFIKFALVGLSGVLVNLFLFLFLVQLGVNKFVASPIAIELSIINNFLLNNYWTFKPSNSSDNLLLKGLKFKGVSLVTLAITYTTFLLLGLAFSKTHPAILQAAAVVPAALGNYFMNSYWTFKNQKRDGNRKTQQLTQDKKNFSVEPSLNVHHPTELETRTKVPYESIDPGVGAD